MKPAALVKRIQKLEELGKQYQREVANERADRVRELVEQVGAQQAADLLEVSRQRIWQLQQRRKP